MQQRRRLFIVALVVVVLTVGVATASVAAASRSKVARNVTLAGDSIAGLKKPALTEKIEKLDEQLRAAKVKVSAPKGGFTLTLNELGASIDVSHTVAKAMAVGRKGNPLARAFGAMKALFSDRSAPIEVEIDEAVLRRAVTEHDPGPKELSKEPSLSRKGGVFVAVAGTKGSGIDPEDVAAALPDAVRAGIPITIRVPRGVVAPQYSLTDAEALARKANKLGELSLRVVGGDTTKTIGASMLASWIDAIATPEALLLGVNGTRAASDLNKLFPNVGKPVIETRFGVNAEGKPVVTPGQSGTKCCDHDAVEATFTAAIAKPPVKAIPLPLKVSEPQITADEAEALGIKEVVGTFTTKHPCCAPRVTNIHRISDLVRGTVIKPNTRLSINNLVGKRTTANGFVVDHVIEDGRFADAVGGGISQFATTLFNAAFFAGLSVPEYQSHSIYISRYPYGREATLSYPHPDLVISNITPHGILVWPTYSGTTLTVTLYGTKYAPGTQTNQTTQKHGVCTQVITERTRTFPDGQKKTDKFRATYRPQEGVNCDGSGTPVTTTTPKTATTKPPATTAPSTTQPTNP